MFLFFYHLLWTVGFIFLLPVLLIGGKERILRRFRHEGLPVGLATKTIWIHALSVGEVISAIPLVEALVSQRGQENVIFTATTAQGLAVARKEMANLVRWVSGMPLDAWWLVRSLVAAFNPAVLVLVETDIWPALLYHLKEKGARIILVNGRISPRTFKFYRRFGRVASLLFDPFDLCLVQSELDRKRLVDAGVDPHKVKIAGNIKFDRSQFRMTEAEVNSQRITLALAPGDNVFVAGSTHAGEETTVLDVFRRLRRDFPGLRLILAPRRVDQAAALLDLARKMGFTSVLRTDLRPNEENYDVLVLDTIGELATIYAVGTVSFVGGSLVPEGGHNLLEPAAHGCPVLFGPHTFNFSSMAEALVRCGGGVRVENGDALLEAAKDLLSSREARDRSGRLARRFVEENRGALGRVVSAIDKSLQGSSLTAAHENTTDPINGAGR